jgi:N-acyl-D-aspartate/D-glutamate deacylase
MDETLQSRLLLDPIVCLCTDGGPGMRHPRATGTYARWIEKYVVADKRLSLEEAVRKATGLPASILRLADRGTIRPGANADLVLFDPSRVRARSDYTNPFAPSEGFDLVVVNGQPAFENGERVANAGRLLRHVAGRAPDAP